MTEPKDQRIAFALGGLGGFNFHGAGVLQAAIDSGVEPDLISCTSGQIAWVWRYLLQRNGEKDPETQQPVSLRADVDKEVEETNVFADPFKFLDATAMALSGDPKKFSLAIEQFWSKAYLPYIPSSPYEFSEMFTRFGNEILDRIRPAQVFVPERSKETKLSMGRCLAKSDIGIIFNGYDLINGREVLYMNQQAQQLLQLNRPGSYNDGQIDEDKHRQICLLNPDDDSQLENAINDALWLYLYGFKKKDGSPQTVIDGAYHRQLILNELAPAADRVYAAVPQTLKWTEELPANEMEVENLKTQLWFNSSYVAQASHIDLINDLIDKGRLDTDFKKVELTTIRYGRHIRYFDYFVERQRVFDDAYDNAIAQFVA